MPASQPVYKRMGQSELAERHEQLHLKYKADDNASDVARPEARRKYPAANHAAEQLVIYSLGPNPAATNP